MSAVIVHSFIPAGKDGGIGGFDWAIEGTPSEAPLRAQFALDSDTGHHDYQPSHVHRLIRLAVDSSITGEDLTEHIGENYLDAIEGGELDSTPAFIAWHNPNTQGASL